MGGRLALLQCWAHGACVEGAGGPREREDGAAEGEEEGAGEHGGGFEGVRARRGMGCGLEAPTVMVRVVVENVD